MTGSLSNQPKESPTVQGKSHEAEIVLSIFQAVINQQQEFNNCGVLPQKEKAVLEGLFNKSVVTLAENWQENFSDLVLLEMSQLFFHKLGSNSSKVLDIGVTGIRNREVEIVTMIDDDDEQTRNQIYLAKAFTNQAFSKTGFRMNVLLFEKSEGYLIPNSFKQYQSKSE
ncbi:hypothetical protein [Microcystis phage Mae-Yong924-2]|nr:hypothetical protein [Microcystis phage Mea-Yong924-1]QYC50714.1 hypothetical protein [Microcystis phage Mae-Yong924-2]